MPLLTWSDLTLPPLNLWNYPLNGTNKGKTMLCPECLEYDIENEIEIEPTYTCKEKTKIKDLEDELHLAYTLVGEQGEEIYKLKEQIRRLNG